MTLITEVQENPLDPAYALAAHRRQARGSRRRSPLARLGVLALATALGFGLMAATDVLRSSAAPRLVAREGLIGQIEARSAIQETLIAGNGELNEEIRLLQESALSAQDPALLAQLEILGVTSGIQPVAGPGLVVELRDSERSATEPDLYSDERVQAIDLQLVVNAMWAAGAEAVSVNGSRVGGLGAIRSAGDAVLVDLSPVMSPYEVAAIGDVDGLRSGLGTSSAASHLALLRDRYQIAVTSRVENDLWMPGIRSASLRYATVLDDGNGEQS